MQCAEALENLIESDAWSGTDHLLCRLNSLTGVIENPEICLLPDETASRSLDVLTTADRQ